MQNILSCDLRVRILASIFAWDGVGFGVGTSIIRHHVHLIPLQTRPQAHFVVPNQYLNSLSASFELSRGRNLFFFLSSYYIEVLAFLCFSARSEDCLYLETVQDEMK